MKINNNISILKDPKILSLELEMLMIEYNKIQKYTKQKNMEIKFENINDRKRLINNKIDNIIKFILDNKIIDSSLLDCCENCCNNLIYDFDIDESAKKKFIFFLNSIENLMRNDNKIKNIDDIDIFINKPLIEKKKYIDKIELPVIDDSEIKLYERFRHEKSIDRNNEADQEKMDKIELKYKEYYSDSDVFSDAQGLCLEPKCNFEDKSDFPINILIGKSATDYNVGVFTNVKDSGNIWIKTSNNDEDKKLVDNFIISYMFKILESFPLGRIQFYVLDNDNKFNFIKFKNNMNAANANNLCKNTISLLRNIDDLLNIIQNEKCSQISTRLTTGINDIYDLCKEDDNETLKFVILNDPIQTFTEQNLQSLLSLSRLKDTAHRCGFRFLIISKERDVESYNISLQNDILRNCDIQYKVIDQTFALGNEAIFPIEINQDLIKYIEYATNVLFTKLKKKGASRIRYSDILPKGSICESLDSPSIVIPVGKEGSEIFNLTLSSKNIEETSEGAILNYMVVGQTGSGKSSFMHNLIINGARKYNPNDLIFRLLDFKHGQEIEIYKKANIPHIDLLSSRNTKEDAIKLLNKILSEIKERVKIFSKNGVNNIYDYNKKMDDNNLSHIPHIIVLIDEAQELFSQIDDTGDEDTIFQKIKEIKDSIGKIAQQSRSSGIHLVLIAQNLISTPLEDIFLAHAVGKVVFSLDESAFSGSGLGKYFEEQSQEIPRLPRGSAYIDIKSTIKHKVKFAFEENSELNEYFKEIRETYSKYNNMKTKIIGETSKLECFTDIHHKSDNYHNIINKIINPEDNQKAIIGEDSYSLEPLELFFSSDKNSSILIHGGTNKISTSIFKSLIKSLINSINDIYIINCDRTKSFDENTNKNLGNILNFYCRLKGFNSETQENVIRKLSPAKETKKILEDIYSEYLKRKDKVASTIDDEDINFKPIYLFINDIGKIDDLEKNIELFNQNLDKDDSELSFEQNEYDKYLNESLISRGEPIQNNPIFMINSLGELIRYGYKYSIYVVVSMIGYVNDGVLEYKNSFEKFILYNDINKDFSEFSWSNVNRINCALAEIKNIDGEETRAIYIDDKGINKFRPIIYSNSELERSLEEKE